jgi:hypothetical protein
MKFGLYVFVLFESTLVTVIIGHTVYYRFNYTSSIGVIFAIITISFETLEIYLYCNIQYLNNNRHLVNTFGKYSKILIFIPSLFPIPTLFIQNDILGLEFSV